MAGQYTFDVNKCSYLCSKQLTEVTLKSILWILSQTYITIMTCFIFFIFRDDDNNKNLTILYIGFWTIVFGAIVGFLNVILV